RDNSHFSPPPRLVFVLARHRGLRVQRLADVEPLHQHEQGDRQRFGQEDPSQTEQEREGEQREQQQGRRQFDRMLLNERREQVAFELLYQEEQRGHERRLHRAFEQRQQDRRHRGKNRAEKRDELEQGRGEGERQVGGNPDQPESEP